MKTLLSLSLALTLAGACLAQADDPMMLNIAQLEPTEDYENVWVKKLATDERSSSFMICVKESVKAHRHAEHSETVYVISGKAEMTIGDQTKVVEAGDFIYIPQNAIHSVKVLSETPVKVLSIQAPEFHGKDRIFVEE